MHTPKHKQPVSISNVGYQVPKHVKSNGLSIALLTISCILAIVFTVLPSFFIEEQDITLPQIRRRPLTKVSLKTSFGIWKAKQETSINGSDSVTTTDVTCGESSDNECFNAIFAKCNSNKAFSIIGIVANLVALLLICFNMSNNIAYYLILLAFVSYLIIMALFVSYKEGGDNNIDSDCALFRLLDFGPAFYLCVVCVVLTLGAIVSK